MNEKPADFPQAFSAAAVEVALAVVLEQGYGRGRVLVSRRLSGAVLGDRWEFPGGKVEPGESPEEAAVREVMEELGVAVTAMERLAPAVHDYPHGRVILHPVLCRYAAGEPQALGVADWFWAEVHALETLTFPEANAALLPGIIAWIRQRVTGD